MERALGMDGSIPRSSQEFVRRVSSRAYDMRRNLMQSLDSISYDGIQIPQSPFPFSFYPQATLVLIQIVMDRRRAAVQIHL